MTNLHKPTRKMKKEEALALAQLIYDVFTEERSDDKVRDKSKRKR